jgi:tetratricopeptide (TPR) repeat protein
MWWILMEQNSNFYVDAWKYIDKALEINTKNPMINLVKWKLEIKLGNIDKAFIYFKKTVSLDQDWEFWKIAKDELDNIQINK